MSLAKAPTVMGCIRWIACKAASWGMVRPFFCSRRREWRSIARVIRRSAAITCSSNGSVFDIPPILDSVETNRVHDYFLHKLRSVNTSRGKKRISSKIGLYFQEISLYSMFQQGLGDQDQIVSSQSNRWLYW
jgi:hypothetical protein